MLLGLMGSVGNLAIAAALPAMGYIYDQQSVAHIPNQLRDVAVTSEPANWALQLAGIKTAEKINLDEVKTLSEPDKKLVAEAEAQGAAMAFRRVSFLPIALVVIFGSITLSDKLRGGYKPEILLSREEENELLSGGVQGPAA